MQTNDFENVDAIYEWLLKVFLIVGSRQRTCVRGV